MQTLPKIHPFELSNCGRAPFRFVGFWSMPSKAVQEANPEAYAGAMRDAPKVTRGGLGVCTHCGTGISNHCVIADADGQTFFVGSDCVEKTDDFALTDRAAIALRKAARERSAARKEQKRRQWIADHADEIAAHNARLAAEKLEREQAEAARMAPRVALLAPLARNLRDGRGGFCDSVAADLERGVIPEGRGRSITLEILGKCCGRRGSAAFEAEVERLEGVLDAAGAL